MNKHTNNLYTIEGLKKAFLGGEYDAEKGLYAFKFLTKGLKGMKTIELIYKVRPDSKNEVGALESIDYGYVSKKVANKEKFLEKKKDDIVEIFEKMAQSSQLEIEVEGNIYFETHRVMVTSEKLNGLILKEAEKIVSNKEETITVRYSERKKGLLILDKEINELFKNTTDKNELFNNPSKLEVIFQGKKLSNGENKEEIKEMKFYVHDGDYYLFKPYDFEKIKNFSLFVKNEKGISIDEYFYPTQNESKTYVQLVGEVKEKLTDVTVENVIIHSQKVYDYEEEAFSEGQIVQYMFSEQLKKGKVVEAKEEELVVEPFGVEKEENVLSKNLCVKYTMDVKEGAEKVLYGIPDCGVIELEIVSEDEEWYHLEANEESKCDKDSVYKQKNEKIYMELKKQNIEAHYPVIVLGEIQEKFEHYKEEPNELAKSLATYVSMNFATAYYKKNIEALMSIALENYELKEILKNYLDLLNEICEEDRETILHGKFKDLILDLTCKNRK